ncbi:MAG: hypothetical protein Ct9H90mP17_3680 [Actinomycetota bacterium]|nr:MAG: hypothetical protein Ct9H90mP17_3680 [Actinomycetota bacterium]
MTDPFSLLRNPDIDLSIFFDLEILDMITKSFSQTINFLKNSSNLIAWPITLIFFYFGKNFCTEMNFLMLLLSCWNKSMLL